MSLLNRLLVSLLRAFHTFVMRSENVSRASSMIFVSGLTWICSFMTSPHSGAPTRPVPTVWLLLSIEPTLRGLV